MCTEGYLDDLLQIKLKQPSAFIGAIGAPSRYCIYLISGLDGNDQEAQRVFEHHAQGCLYCQDFFASRLGNSITP